MPQPQADDVVLVNSPQPKGTGDYENRAGFPVRTLAQMGLRARVVMTHQPRWFEHALAARLAVVLMTGTPNVHELLLARRALGRPTAVEISDNFLHFQEGNPLKAYYDQPWVQDAFFSQMAAADLVQFSSPGLQQRFGPFCARTLLAQNAVEPAPLPPAQPGPPWVVGIAFSAGHFQDAARCAPALLRLCQRRQDVSLAVMCDPQLFAPFAALGPRAVNLPPQPYHQYRDTIARWHALVLPSTRDAFNLCRSDGKWLDAARAGAVAVAPRQSPFDQTVRDGETGLLYAGEENLEEVLMALFNDPARWRVLRQQAHEHVTTQRHWRTEMANRLLAWQGVVVLPPAHSHPPRLAREDFSTDENQLYNHLAALAGGQGSVLAQHALLWCRQKAEEVAIWPGIWEALAFFAGVFPPPKHPAWHTPPHWELHFCAYRRNPQKGLPPPLEQWPTAQALEAIQRLGAGDTPTARKHLKQALADNPNSPIALRLSILLAVQEERTVKAAHLLKRLEALDDTLYETFRQEVALFQANLAQGQPAGDDSHASG